MLTPQGFTTSVKAPPSSPNSFQLVPHSVEAEAALLGALILDPDQMLNVQYLEPGDFYLINNGYLFEAMKDLFARHNGYDWLTLVEYLQSKNRLGDIGGEVAISDLVNATPTSYGAPEYAEIVYRHSISRQVIIQTLGITEAAYRDDPDRSGEMLVSNAIDRLASIDASRNVSRGPQPISVGVNELFDSLEEIEANGSYAGLQTGIKTLDHIVGGLPGPTLTLLAGRPGMGKSALALQIAYNVSKGGIPVLFFSLEMGKKALAARLVSLISGIPYESFNRPGVDMDRVIDAGNKVADLPIIFDTTPGLTVGSIRSIAQKTILQYPIGLIIIDHGGLIRPEKFTGNKYQDQSQVAAETLGLSKRLDLPVLCLLQLSREVESSADKRPRMHHLRDSGDWEQNADNIWFLYRDEVYHNDTQFPGLGEIGIAKNRGGKVGTVTVAANVALNRFVDLEMRTI